MKYHSHVPESIDGRMTGRMLYFDEAGNPVAPQTVTAVDGTDAVVLELEAPTIITPPAAPEVAPSADEED
jgi:hypothetical protein